MKAAAGARRGERGTLCARQVVILGTRKAPSRRPGAPPAARTWLMAASARTKATTASESRREEARNTCWISPTSTRAMTCGAGEASQGGRGQGCRGREARVAGERELQLVTTWHSPKRTRADQGPPSQCNAGLACQRPKISSAAARDTPPRSAAPAPRRRARRRSRRRA
jgi:hypothetical protein